MTVIVSAHNVLHYPEGGGHFWVYLQYAQGLRSAGCDVWWLEQFWPTPDAAQDARNIATLSQRLARCGFAGKLILYTAAGEFVGMSKLEAAAIFRDTDLLLNFHQRIQSEMLAQFRRTALVDIDPGLLQYWISNGELAVAPHDRYFTTGETVGTPRAKFPDCGLSWIPIRPPVSLDLWPHMLESSTGVFTTVSTWSNKEWVQDGNDLYENSKRASFLQFAELPRITNQALELALCLGPGDEPDRELLTRNQWKLRSAWEVAGSPEKYREYLQSSRGEFSCAKPSCMRFQNAWISDRTLCYLASGKPAVVQDTGPSEFLPRAFGLFRFSTLAEAAQSLDEVASNYGIHSRAARDLAEGFFDAQRVAESILSRSF